MPIPVADIITQLRGVGLDAQPDTDYYDDLIDLVPAIDSSVKWLMSAVNSLRSQNKKTDEIVRELTVCRIYRTSSQSRIQVDEDIWTIDAVNPLPLTVSNGGATPPTPANAFNSLLRTDLSFLKSYYSAERKTVEEASENRNNPFSTGYLPPSVSSAMLVEGSNLNIDFSYLAPNNYTTGTVTGTFVEINPEIPLKLCAIFLTLNPAKVATTADIILFPVSVFNIIYEKALQFVSYSQGDQTNIWTVTEDDLRSLLKAVS